MRRFLRVIRARKRWQVRFGMGLAPDRNIGTSSGARIIMPDTALGFSGMTSTDLERSLERFGFDDGPVEGAFSAHEEVAGMFQRNDNNVFGSFGAVRE